MPESGKGNRSIGQEQQLLLLLILTDDNELIEDNSVLRCTLPPPDDTLHYIALASIDKDPQFPTLLAAPLGNLQSFQLPLQELLQAIKSLSCHQQDQKDYGHAFVRALWIGLNDEKGMKSSSLIVRYLEPLIQLRLIEVHGVCSGDEDGDAFFSEGPALDFCFCEEAEEGLFSETLEITTFLFLLVRSTRLVPFVPA